MKKECNGGIYTAEKDQCERKKQHTHGGEKEGSRGCRVAKNQLAPDEPKSHRIISGSLNKSKLKRDARWVQKDDVEKKKENWKDTVPQKG